MNTLRLVVIVTGAVLFLGAYTWGLRRAGTSWSDLDAASGFLVNVTILAGAVAAIIKFQLYNLLGHRWRSDLSCLHHELPDGDVLFLADYTLTNTGQRPLKFSKVEIKLARAKSDGVLLHADEESVLAVRTLEPSESTLKGLFHLEPGERSIFTLRCRLPELDAAVFIICGFELKQRRVPAAYVSFYMRDAERQTGSTTAAGRPKRKVSGV